MLEIGQQRIQHQVATFIYFKKLVSSTKFNDEKIAPKVFENWKRGMEAGGTTFITGCRI